MEIENRVIEKIKQRQEVGMKKYGMSVKDNPAGILEWLNHLQEELLDASIYIEKLKDEISNLVEAPVSPKVLTEEEQNNYENAMHNLMVKGNND